MQRLQGGAGNCDAYHMTAPDPDGAYEVMLLALEDAGMKPEDIDYINVHGTSTGLGDISEPTAILKSVWRACLQVEYQFYEIYDRSPFGGCRCCRSDRLYVGCKE